jgi:hypothetical protein
MDINSIIKEQRNELESIEKHERIILREKLGEARADLKHPNILVITGIRRCGKSIFSYLIEKDSKFAYINFDDERLSGMKGEELNKVLEAFYELYGDVEYVVFDEIQNIPHWELFINRMRRTKKVIITGSNSNLLSGELATHLTGRYLDIRLFPFSFIEFLNLKKFKFEKIYTTQEKSILLNFLREYLENGGLPESYKFGKSIIMKLYDDIITKDILLRHDINKIDELKKLAKYLITNSSEELSYSKMANVLGVKHVSTISNWVSYLEDSFLIFRLEKFDFKLKQQFMSSKKIYCIDTGIVNSIGFKFSENKGKIIENAVAIELQRRKYSKGNLEVYYWKDTQNNEVDFILKEEKNITQLIQVSHISIKEEIKDREINSLLKAKKEFGCKNLLVITWDYEAKEKFEYLGIEESVVFIPLWKWLLSI